MLNIKIYKISEIFENNQPCRYWGVFEYERDLNNYLVSHQMIEKFTDPETATKKMQEMNSSVAYENYLNRLK